MRWMCILVLCLPTVAAGTPADPDIVDAQNDVKLLGLAPATYPCNGAIDVAAFWAEWTDEGVALHYQFVDMAKLETLATALDTTGRCFYSQTWFKAEVGEAATREEVLYIDYMGSPAFDQGWRFQLHEAGIDVPGVVDTAAGRIEVLLPLSYLGAPQAGDRVGDFWVRTASAATVAGGTFQDDAPDAGPCECWVEYQPPQSGPEPTLTQAPEPSSPKPTATPPPATTTPPTGQPTTSPPAPSPSAAPPTQRDQDRPTPVPEAAARGASALPVALLVLALAALVLRTRAT